MGGKKTVLVVDDDQAILGVIQDVLKKEGFQVELASDIKGIMQIIERSHIDLMLLDVMLPLFTGPEILKRLKSSFKDKVTFPVIYISGVMEQSEVDMEGAVDFIQKPFTNQELLSKVKKAMKIS